MTVTVLNTKRKPVTFTFEITQHGDDAIDVTVFDVADDDNNLQSIARLLRRAADHIGGKV